MRSPNSETPFAELDLCPPHYKSKVVLQGHLDAYNNL